MNAADQKQQSLTDAARARGFTDPRPTEDAKAQCNAKVSALAYWHFKRAVALRNDSVAQALERLMEAYSVELEGTRAIHVDGTECPLSQLMTNLAAGVERMVQR